MIVSSLNLIAMKNLIQISAMSNLVKIAFAAIVCSFIFFSFIPQKEISVCHVPPGNPGNCHEITISVNALDAHLDHGDLVFCHDREEYNLLLKMMDNDPTKIIKVY